MNVNENKALNRKLPNKPFAKKKEILMASKVFVDDDILSADQWRHEEIVSRTKTLA
jgi:hypothetical protein